MNFDKDQIKGLMEEGPVIKTQEKKSTGKEGLMFLESLTKALDGQGIAPEVEKLTSITKATDRSDHLQQQHPYRPGQQQPYQTPTFQEGKERDLPPFSLSEYKNRASQINESARAAAPSVDSGELRQMIKKMVSEEMESLIEKVITDKMLRLYSEEFIMSTVKSRIKKK